MVKFSVSGKIGFFILLVLSAAGCSTLSNDLRMDTHAKYLSTKITQDTFLIYCYKAQEKDYADVERRLLYEASRTALENGFSYFLVLKEIYKSGGTYMETSGPAGVALGYADSENIDIDFIKRKLGMEPKFSLVIKYFGTEHPWGAVDARKFLRQKGQSLKSKGYYNNKWQ